MNDKELNELLEYNQEYMDARLSEDVFGGDYTSEVELKHLEKAYDKLQSNWNSLREWLKTDEQKYFAFQPRQNGKTLQAGIKVGLDMALDKMNELEGKDKE